MNTTLENNRRISNFHKRQMSSLQGKVNFKQMYMGDHLQQEKGSYQTKWKGRSEGILFFLC
jgi:hypothetical protein